jgi:hypothetical protein
MEGGGIRREGGTRAKERSEEVRGLSYTSTEDVLKSSNYPLRK